MGKTKIEWTEHSWNPVTGCTKISPGCKNCYAERIAARFAGRNFPAKPDHFKITLHPERLDQPLHMKKPRMIFVCSMGDLFHEDVPAEYIVDVFGIMSDCRQHTFQVLTKRPERVQSVLYGEEGGYYLGAGDYYSHIWLGVTAENQEIWDERVPELMKLKEDGWTVFVSCEPQLGPIDFKGQNPDWLICGGETGPGWRYYADSTLIDVEWVNAFIKKNGPVSAAKIEETIFPALWFDWTRGIRDQCKEFDIPFFGKKVPGGGELPAALRIRQWPRKER